MVGGLQDVEGQVQVQSDLMFLNGNGSFLDLQRNVVPIVIRTNSYTLLKEHSLGFQSSSNGSTLLYTFRTSCPYLATLRGDK